MLLFVNLYGKCEELGCLSHIGILWHTPEKTSLASGRRGRGFESRRLDYLAGATGNVDFIGVSGSFFVPAVHVSNRSFYPVLGSNSNRVLTKPDYNAE